MNNIRHWGGSLPAHRCCEDFEKHAANQGPGLGIWRAFSIVGSVERRMFAITFRGEGAELGSELIYYCPWCGADLGATARGATPR